MTKKHRQFNACEVFGFMKVSNYRVDGVTGAQVSHQEGSAIVTMSAPVDDEILKKAVEDQDYKVLEIV